MVPLQIKLDPSFFEEEVRDGYTVSAETKKLWAIQLDLLYEFDRVCKLHGLRYFLDSGTCLGAVRHKGYIPWDDDIDVIMLREDYNKLLEIGPSAFKSPYFFQNAMTDADIPLGYSKLRRDGTCQIKKAVIKEKLQCHNGIWIDIFVLDALPEDEQLRHEREKERDAFNQRMFMLVPPRGDKGLKKIAKMIRYAGYRLRYGSLKKEFIRYNRFAQEFESADAEHVGAFTFFRTFFYKKEWYASTVSLPFEGFSFPVPAGYHEYLTCIYGADYMTPKKFGNGHDCLIDTDKSYKEILK